MVAMDVKASGGGPRRVTLKDVAEAVGVAPSTVSNAYNRPDQLSPELRERILAAAARLGYHGPDPAARQLRRGVTQTIGVLFPGPVSYAFTSPAAGEFVRGVALEAERAGYTLQLIGTPPSGPDGAIRPPLPVASASVDGFVIQCFVDDDPMLQTALARALPTVMVDRRPVEGAPWVSVDDEGGARAAAEHLIELGHRRLGVISMELDLAPRDAIVDAARQAQAAYAPSRSRLAGYRAAVAAAGLDWDRDVVVYECADDDPTDGRRAAAALLDQRPPPTALLAMSDQLALGALAHARDAGLSVPERLSVVGFDDAPGAASARPPLTTVHQSHVDKGRQAGRLLLARLAGEAPAPVALPTRLVVRASSGPAPE